MHTDGATPYATRQIAILDEPRLRPACGVPVLDAICDEPAGVEGEGDALLDVRPEQVEDEEDELVDGRGAFATAPGDETPADEEEERCRRKEGEEAECDDGDEAVAEFFGEWGEGCR